MRFLTVRNYKKEAKNQILTTKSGFLALVSDSKSYFMESRLLKIKFKMHKT